MILLGWNCRGLGQPCTVHVLKDILKSHKPNTLFFSETLVKGNEIEALAPKIGIDSFYSVDRQGRGGGLAIFWKRNVKCLVLDSSSNHIDINIEERNNVNWV